MYCDECGKQIESLNDYGYCICADCEEYCEECGQYCYGDSDINFLKVAHKSIIDSEYRYRQTNSGLCSNCIEKQEDETCD